MKFIFRPSLGCRKRKCCWQKRVHQKAHPHGSQWWESGTFPAHACYQVCDGKLQHLVIYLFQCCFIADSAFFKTDLRCPLLIMSWRSCCWYFGRWSQNTIQMVKWCMSTFWSVMHTERLVSVVCTPISPSVEYDHYTHVTALASRTCSTQMSTSAAAHWGFFANWRSQNFWSLSCHLSVPVLNIDTNMCGVMLF